MRKDMERWFGQAAPDVELKSVYKAVGIALLIYVVDLMFEPLPITVVIFVVMGNLLYAIFSNKLAAGMLVAAIGSAFIGPFILQPVGRFIILAIPLIVIGRLVQLAITRKLGTVPRNRFIITGIYFLLGVLIIVTFVYNNKISRQRAEDLIAACESYKQVHGKYPDKLKELVPEFVNEIPLARYSLGFNKFRYYSYKPRKPDAALSKLLCKPDKGIPPEGRHVLEYTDITPFGRPFYMFEEKRWSYLD